MKKVKFNFNVREKHWVGNGFYVHGILRPNPEINHYTSPFILMDYASPYSFSPGKEKRGVGVHPHRGFETVTFAYQGEIEHRDSSGGGGLIYPGDVQWMTAGCGVVHDEFHSQEFTERGGVFEMVQLWVNLPKKDKMTKPKYQSIKNEDIPVIQIGDSSSLRVISGDFEKTKGPATSFTKINIFDLKSEQADLINLKVEEETNTLLLILDGDVKIGDDEFSKQSILIFEREEREVKLNVSNGFKGLFLNGEPIDEPIFAYGPFVMNTREEIMKAIEDFQNGKMGNL